MKLLLLAILMSFQSSQTTCDDFYKKELDPLSVEGKVTKKEISDEFYIIYVVNKKEETIRLRFLKNMSGFEIYNFILTDSCISKRKGDRSVHILTENKLDKSFKGRIFDKLCY